MSQAILGEASYHLALLYIRGLLVLLLRRKNLRNLNNHSFQITTLHIRVNLVFFVSELASFRLNKLVNHADPRDITQVVRG